VIETAHNNASSSSIECRESIFALKSNERLMKQFEDIVCADDEQHAQQGKAPVCTPPTLTLPALVESA